MSMTWNEAFEAIADARTTIRQADNRIKQMASLIVGKLQSADVESYALCKLKKELRNFKKAKKKWKE